MAKEMESLRADVELRVRFKDGQTRVMSLKDVPVSDSSFYRAPVEDVRNGHIFRIPGPYTVVTLTLHPDDHPQWTDTQEVTAMNKCLNGHPANSNHECSDPNCTYKAADRHKGPTDPDRSKEDD